MRLRKKKNSSSRLKYEKRMLKTLMDQLAICYGVKPPGLTDLKLTNASEVWIFVYLEVQYVAIIESNNRIQLQWMAERKKIPNSLGVFIRALNSILSHLFLGSSILSSQLPFRCIFLISAFIWFESCRNCLLGGQMW